MPKLFRNYDNASLLDFLDAIMREDDRRIVYDEEQFSAWWEQKLGGNLTTAQKGWGDLVRDAAVERAAARAEAIRVEEIPQPARAAARGPGVRERAAGIVNVVRGLIGRLFGR